MKVNNEYIQISLGNRVFTRKNMILNRYLQHLIDIQFKGKKTPHEGRFTEVFFQLDTKKTINKDDIINYWDRETGNFNFSGLLVYGSYNQSYTKNTIKLIQTYTQGAYFELDGGYVRGDSTDLINHKLTGVGFGINAGLMTWVDLSDMDIIIQPGEKLTISRVDNFSTDLEIIGCDYPRHLTNINRYDNNLPTTVFLYSVGLGEDKNYMNKEYVIGEDVNVIDEDLGFKIPISKETNTQIYPSEDIQPFTNLYPSNSTDNYIIYKYKIYKIIYGEDQETFEDTGEYYLGSIKIKNNDIQYIKTKIRSD